jgi:3-isopropylmalate dehydrogenase
MHGAGGGRFVYDLRGRLDLFCKISPVQVFPELQGSVRIKPEHVEDVDILFVRENCGGIYQGASRIKREVEAGRVIDHAFSYSEAQVRRVSGVAARLAATRSGGFAVVVKDGGLPELSGLWRECAASAAAESGVQAKFLNVDHAAYEIVQSPRRFDVVLTPNLFGDVLVDLSAVISGSRGLGFSGDVFGEGAVYQTNHGAAHDLAGADSANPVGQILSLAMLLRESFGLAEAAARIELAVRECWRRGWRTPDLAEPGCRLVGTREAGELTAEAVLTGA